MDFEQLVRERHSAVNFDKDFKMTDMDFKKILDLTKLAPSPYNLQSTKFLIVQEEELKEQLYQISYQQYKIKSSSAAVIILADKNAVEAANVNQMLTPMRTLRIISEDEYNLLTKQIDGYRENLKAEPHKLSKELQISAAIASTYFSLSAEHYGFNTCTMHVQNIEQTKQLFNIPQNLEPYLMITVGKATPKQRPRGYRRPFNDITIFDKFR